MSKDSSSKFSGANRPLNGWAAGILSILGTMWIYLSVPVLAAIMLVLYKVPSGYSTEQLQTWLSASVVAQFFYILIVEVITVAVIFFLLKLFKWSWRSIGLVKPNWYDPLLGVAAAVPYFAIFIVLSDLVTRLVPSFDPTQEQQIGFETATQNWQLALIFVGLVILVPLVEEILFRGFLYTGLKKWLPRIAAMVLVSLFFAIPHLGGSASGWNSLSGLLWVAGLDTFILGLFLVGLREYTGNLWASITLHAVKNCVGFVFLFHLIG